MHDKLITRYNFLVEWGGKSMGFSEVSGLNMEIEPILVRNGDFREEVEIKIPGQIKYSEVSFKRGISRNDNEIFNWINTKYFGELERRNIVITLLNERKEPVIVWKLKNCFPIQYLGPVLQANDSNIAIETLVVVHEGMTMELLS